MIQRLLMKPAKTSNEFRFQLVELIRASMQSKIKIVMQLQSWIIAHKMNCQKVDCKCEEFKLDEISNNVNSKVKTKQINNYQVDDTVSAFPIQEEEVQHQFQDVNHLTPIQQEFFLSQFLDDQDILITDNAREIEAKQVQKLLNLVISIIGQEIEAQIKIDTQLKFLKICADILLKNQSFRAFFRILQIQSNITKLTTRQQYILAYLKKYLINKMNQKEKFKKNSEKIYILNQLKFEQSFQRFILDIQKITESVDILWKQCANKTFKILLMAEQMDRISQDYLILWSKYQEIEGKYQNPELLLILARFCDLVMGFELEAENLYFKATSLISSIKLQQQKGQLIEENNNEDNKIKHQEYLLNVECSPRQLDKIVFVNQKFLQFCGYKIEDIPIVKSLLPTVIASFHDEKIMNYLLKQERASNKINIKSWIKVKAGYVVPTEIKTIPYIDLKNDLRFITLVKPLHELEIDEIKLHYNQVFTFLVNSFGRLDSVSKEAYEILNLSQKLIDQGIHLSQLLIGFDYDKVSDYQNGQDFLLNKEIIYELQSQLDIHPHNLIQNSVQHSYIINGQQSGIINNLMIASFSNKNATYSSDMHKRISIFDQQQVQMLKIFVYQSENENNQSIRIDQKYYIIHAIPIQEDTSLRDQNYNHFSRGQIQSTLLNKYESSGNEIKNTEAEDESNILNEFGSQSSMTSSQSSRNDKQFQLIRDIKEITQIKNVPPLIVKMRRSLHIFFFTMLVTAIVLLVVNIVDKIYFKQDIKAVEEAFRIQYYISNVRLRFVYMYSYSNKPTPLTQTENELMLRVQHQYGIFTEEFRSNINSLASAVQLLNDDLKGLFFDNSLSLNSVTKAGNIYSTKQSFQSGCQEIISKADQYQYLSFSALKINRSIFGIQYGLENIGSYRLDDNEINSYFIIENLKNSLRSQADIIQNDFSDEVILFGNQSQSNILIFTMVCITVIVGSSILMLPLLFRVDNNLSDSIKTWTQIKPQQKEGQIQRISQFKNMLEKTEIIKSNNPNNIVGKHKNIFLLNQKKLGYNNQKQGQDDKKQQKYKKGIVKLKSHQIENIMDGDEELKEDHAAYEGFNKNSKNRKNAYLMDSPQGAKISHSQQFSLKKGSSKDIKHESDDEEDQNDQSNQSKTQNDGSHHRQENESERIHRYSQLLQLNKYTFSRKLKTALVIIIFSVCLCSMYVGSYMLASKIYDQTIEDFQILTTISGRAPCVARSIFFLFDNYIKNGTLEDGQDLSETIKNCQKLAATLRNLKRDSKLSYQVIQEDLAMIDSDKFCLFYQQNIVGQFSRNKTDQEYLINECSTIDNGLLLLGAPQAIGTIYQQIEQQNIYFMNLKQRDTKSLQALLYESHIQTLTIAYLTYIGPVINKIQRLANQSLYKVMELAFMNLIIMFVIFILFLLLTWMTSIGILIKRLSQTLARSKISVKMIPASILIDIKDQQSLSKDINKQNDNLDKNYI